MLVSLCDLSWEEALDAAKSHGFRLIEACGGGHIPKVHYDPIHLASDASALEKFQESVASRGLQICAFGCHGNPVHPDSQRAQAAHEDFVATCQIASRLGVERVDVLSGCPGGGPHDESVNWIVNSLYPEFKRAYEWQWEERVIPYWREAAKIAEDSGVKVCIEPHPGDVVYNAQTFERLRDAVGPVICANVDPSHLVWQGIDVAKLTERLGEAVAFAHAKDVAFDHDLIRREGLLPAFDYADWDARTWSYRALGYGHPDVYWRDFVIALRRAGYEGPVAIEIEEPYLATDDAIRKSLELLRWVMPAEAPPEGNWFDKYEWAHTKLA